MKTALVLGAGFSGCTAASLLTKAGFNVTVFEGDAHPGGGCWTRFYGGHPYTFGPRVFFSRDEAVIRQLTSYVEIREFYTRTWTFVARDGQLYHYPLQYADLPLMPDYSTIKAELSERDGKAPSVEDFEAYWLDAVGPTLYSKFVSSYSRKMWGVESNRQLTASFEWVNRGTPIRDGDERLYTDQFQGYPRALTGYNIYFEKCLAGCELHFNCLVKRFDPDTRRIDTLHGEFTGDVIVNTIYVDVLFGLEYGRLQFCGRQFVPLWLPTEHAFPQDVTWIHYSGEEEYTRVTEFKKITGYQASSTLLGIEIPAPRGRYYPVQSPTELRRYEQYVRLFPPNFYSIGRLGRFRYQGIPEAIREAIDAVEAIRS
jgi:UDP-galactopyranose mutase